MGNAPPPDGPEGPPTPGGASTAASVVVEVVDDPLLEPDGPDDSGLVQPSALRPASDLERLEIDLTLEGIYRHYGFDFRNYARASMRRRLWNQVRAEKLTTISALLDRVLHDVDCMERLLLMLSVNVTAMYRDPTFFRAFREQVVPLLRSHPFIRIWHAGCSTGEEVYSMAILLEEEGLYNRCRLYATDMNEAVLRRAQTGIFPIEVMQEYTANYLRSGAKEHFASYYTARYGHAIFKQSLRRNIVFSHHNLVTDGSFNEFHVIICRNVMIYFNEQLQTRVHELFYDSLRRFGVLVLGRKESLSGTPHQHDYEDINATEKIYRRRSV
ncbi:MAG: protein-glutamate O-methyltransferase CheR [Nannocystis sp.]|nr:protein-glutamate O-methyltransferase CheR [Nannocystis sp.]